MEETDVLYLGILVCGNTVLVLDPLSKHVTDHDCITILSCIMVVTQLHTPSQTVTIRFLFLEYHPCWQAKDILRKGDSCSNDNGNTKEDSIPAKLNVQ